MKVKLFSVSEPTARKGKKQRDFEAEINQWLAQNPAIDIIRIKQSASGGSFAPTIWLISIWYQQP